MRHHPTMIRAAAAVSLIALAACAAPSAEVRELAEKTAANVGTLSVQLDRLQQNSREVAELRADNIARLHEANARLRARYEIDVELTKKTGDGGNLNLIKNVTAWRDKINAIMAKADGARAKKKKEILDGQTTLDSKKKALTGIAQALAALAKEDKPGDRVRFLKGFAKELQGELDKALEADTESAQAAKALLQKAKAEIGGSGN